MAISTIGTDALAASAVTTTKLASGVPSRSQLPAGTVLQVVQGTYSTETTLTTTADTGLTASITPTSTTSKILVFVTQPYYIVKSTTANAWGTSYLVRGSTTVRTHEFVCKLQGSSSEEFVPIIDAFCYLDSPATTSSITYKTQAKKGFSATSVVAQANSSDSTIILMEVAA